MKTLLTEMIRNLVDYPEKVEINEVKGDKATVLEINVDVKDRGKIIGKEGRNILAIRTILNCIGMKYHKKVSVEIVE